MIVARIPRLLSALLWLAVCASSQAADGPPDDYRKLFEAGVANGAFPALAVGLVDGGDERLWYYGSRGDGQPPDAQSAFELGAATDLFTGLLLAQAVLEGRLRSSATLGSLYPTDFPWRDPTLSQTPLFDLATQDAGLPPQPANLFPHDTNDPYADYAGADLLAWLAHFDGSSLQRDAKGYSILHASVLSQALERIGGAPYARQLEQRVLTPLGMAHTGFADGESLLDGHAFGASTAHWHYAAFAGALGLRSTLPDLMAFVRANLRPEGSSLRAALLLARQEHAEGQVGGLGFGWNVHDIPSGDQQWPLVWRASQTGGFSLFIGFRTDRQQGVVLMCNSLAELAPIGLAWLSGSTAPPTPAGPFVPPPGSEDRYAGLYRLVSGVDVTVRARAEGLYAQLRGQPAWRLMPVAEDVYVAAGDAAGVTFIRNIDAIGGLVLRSGGTYVSARRLSERAPRLQRPHLATGRKLSGYAGDFAFDAATQLRISAQSDAIDAQLTASAPMRMWAYAPDRFAGEDGVNELQFHRDERGRIDRVLVELAGGERTAVPVDWKPPDVAAYTATSPVPTTPR
jgi:D-alanyl-D-alanine-carboxypeptidase/D-alanyl-D-alanine-endopeptidase